MEDWPAAMEEIERLRVAGWLVILKCMPDGYPFWGDEDGRMKLRARYVCETKWMPQHNTSDLRRSMHAWIWGRGQTMIEAVRDAVVRAAEESARYPIDAD